MEVTAGSDFLLRIVLLDNQSSVVQLFFLPSDPES